MVIEGNDSEEDEVFMSPVSSGIAAAPPPLYIVADDLILRSGVVFERDIFDRRTMRRRCFWPLPALGLRCLEGLIESEVSIAPAAVPSLNSDSESLVCCQTEIGLYSRKAVLARVVE